MSSRFPTFAACPIEGSRFANFRERLDAPLPGEETVPSSDVRFAKRLPEFRPQVPASSAKASTPKAKPAKATAKAPSPAERAANARREARARAANVMGSSAYIGREKQAAELLMQSCNRGTRFATSTAIIEELKRRPTDAAVAEQAARARQAAIEAAWTNAAKRVALGMGGIAR